MPKTGNKFLVIEALLVAVVALGLALIIGMALLAGVSWENTLWGKISSNLFQVFLPGIWLAMQFSGGPHGASEINVMFGVFVQTLFMYWLGRAIVFKIKRMRRRR